MKKNAVLFIAVLFLAVNITAQKKILLALSKTDHVLALIDPTTLQTSVRIPVGSDPHEVIASTDGKTAYVTIYGGGSLHELNVIDLTAKKPLINIDTRPLWGPHGIVFVNGKAWFSAEGSKAIGSYDPVTQKLDWSMGTGEDRTHMIEVSKDGKSIYTTNVSSGTVSIFTDTIIQPRPMTPPPGATAPQGNMPPPNLQSRHDWRQMVITTARGSEGLDVSPDGKELWTASSEDGTISIIDLTKKQLATNFAANAQGANRVKFTPDGSKVFISTLFKGDLIVYDAKARKEIKRYKIGNGASGILMDTDGSRAFVACTAENYIAIVDLKTLEVINKITLAGPDGLAWAIEQ